MEQVGILTRRRIDGKIRNFPNLTASLVEEQSKPSSQPDEQPWHWEGHVQAAVVRHIQTLGFRIEFVANTATKQRGKDVIAIAPSGQTSATTIAPHASTLKVTKQMP
jgi:hypothetical protein